MEGVKGGNDAVGELIALSDALRGSDAGTIRDRCEVLVGLGYIQRKGTPGKKWARITITAEGEEALATAGTDEEDADTQVSSADERNEVQTIQDRVRDHLHGVREALEDAVSVASSALDERDKAVARAEAAELRADAAEARLANVRAGIAEVLESDEDSDQA